MSKFHQQNNSQQQKHKPFKQNKHSAANIHEFQWLIDAQFFIVIAFVFAQVAGLAVNTKYL